MALFLLDRAQLGRGGTAGPSGLVEAVAAKAGEGMKVVVVQGATGRIQYSLPSAGRHMSGKILLLFRNAGTMFVRSRICIRELKASCVGGSEG